MSTFTSALTETTPDPGKHVSYAVGMVLGVDDFTQEFTYLASRDRVLAEAALGSGTLTGLKVTVSPGSHGNAGVVQVAPGTAVSPSGQMVTVPCAQCADIDEWLQAMAGIVTGELGSPPAGDLALYILLAYAEQETDPVPIPATPNSTSNGLSAPSRVQDSFQLLLSATAPTEDTGQADAEFATWLAELTYVPRSDSTIDDLLAALRSAAAPGSPPEWPPPPWPRPPRSLAIPRAHATEYLRAAIATWVTELRPTLQAEAAASAGGPPDGDPSQPPPDSFVLATLSVPIGRDGTASDAASVVEDSQAVILPPELVRELTLTSAIPPPQYTSISTTVGAGRFELERKTERSEPELRVVFAQNLHAALVPRPDTPRREGEEEEKHAREHYFRLRLEHGHEGHHRYVITALPLVEGHGARYAIEEVSDPPRRGPGSHEGPFMLRLSPVAGTARSLRVGFSVQITDLGPEHRRRAT